jgi:uncharacterized membrane protein YagU involved in acid resistance
MNRIAFVLFSLVVVGLISFFVRAGIERTDPPQQTGPATPADHNIAGVHANCLGCHGDITGSHDAMFGSGNYSDCLSCHPQQ